MGKTVLYEFLIFNKCGVLIYFEDLEKMETIKVEETIEIDIEFRNKIQNTYSICHNLTQFIGEFLSRMTPGTDKSSIQFNDFHTRHYKLSYYKSPTGLSFVLLSSKDSNNFNKLMAEMYSKVYFEYVVKNPLYDEKQGSIKCTNFSKTVKNFFRSKQLS